MQNGWSNVEIWLCNQGASDFAGRIEYSVFNTSCTEPPGFSAIDITVAADSSVCVCSLNSDKNSVIAIRAIESGKIISENTYIPVPVKYFNLPEAHISITMDENEEEYIFNLLSDRFAHAVELYMEDEDALFSDNFFDLLPGITKQILLIKNDTTAENLNTIINKLKFRTMNSVLSEAKNA